MSPRLMETPRSSCRYAAHSGELMPIITVGASSRQRPPDSRTSASLASFQRCSESSRTPSRSKMTTWTDSGRRLPGRPRRTIVPMARSTRLVAASLIDWTGTGFYLAISAIFLTRSVGLTPSQVGLALAGAGAVAFAGSVHVARLGDRFGQRRVLVGLHVVRALGFLALAMVHDLPATLVTLGAIALADQASASVTQALAGELAGTEDRVALMARLRVVTNIGITLGTIPAG